MLPLPLPLLRFLAKPSRTSHRRFSGLRPLRKPSPSVCAPDVYSGSGAAALLSFRTFRALPFLSASSRFPFPCTSPLALDFETSLNISKPEPQGFQPQEPWLSPSVEGAGPFGVSHRLSSATSSGNALMTDYFFLSAPELSYEIPACPLRHQRLPS